MKKKQLTEWVHQLVSESDTDSIEIVKEIQLGEATVRLGKTTDANLHKQGGGMIVQLISNVGSVGLDVKDVRALLTYIKKMMGYSYMPRLKKEQQLDEKIVSLPSGIKADLDTLKGLTIFTFKGKPIKFDRQQVAMFIRSIAKHMGIR